MSDRILVKIDGDWTDDPGALAASISAMAAKEELQTKLIAALEAEIARLTAALKVIDECFADMKTRLEEHLLPGPQVKAVGNTPESPVSSKQTPGNPSCPPADRL